MKSQRRRSITWPSVRTAPTYPRKAKDKAAAPLDRPPWPKPAVGRPAMAQGQQKDQHQ